MSSLALAPAPKNSLQGRNLLNVSDLRPDQLADILRLAGFLKARPSSVQHGPLRGRTVALLFEKPSLRTRVAPHSSNIASS